MDRDKQLSHHHRIEEAEAVIHNWILEFIDHDRPQCPPMTALDLIASGHTDGNSSQCALNSPDR
jgi:hypothetical protein